MTGVFRSTRIFNWIIRLCFAVGILLTVASLWRWGAVEVRGRFEEVFFLTVVGVVWLAISTKIFPWLGLSISDDVVERRNVGALIALCGAILSLSIIFAAGNLGEGPSYWENVFSVGLGTVSLFVLWLLVEIGGRVSISIAEERDVASGIRLGGFLLAAGLIIARAIAGDWHSEAATVHDFFHDGWPVLIVCLIAIFTERFLSPTLIRPLSPWAGFGLLPAIIYLMSAIAWMIHLGRWEGMPR